jgi:hypothetical protein
MGMPWCISTLFQREKPHHMVNPTLLGTNEYLFLDPLHRRMVLDDLLDFISMTYKHDGLPFNWQFET